MVELHAHNKTAYEAAVAMLAEKGRAAIVHPTGTGKSFIGFALCADKQEKRICWLAPSEYIWQTQLENLEVQGGTVPSNVQFLTYAKLMLLDEAQIAELAPDYIILDEYHRAGAPFWQRGVERFLQAFPDVPMLGLSATNIRYLDNQRDMAAELFAGNIASEMTLGEAIVRGILEPPKYVLSLFSYKHILQGYEKRIARSKSKPVQDKAEEYLQALRRALEQADGLADVFAKNMDEPHGKYLVFCANKEHMDEMMALAPTWFAKVDATPHLYSVYSADAQAEAEFTAFKTDNSKHLRLLYCIDALNEGIHVDNLSGVILLRPTVSPIVYKQQIGRTLSTTNKKNAVIFDIVLNIENLYSIGAIEEEMQLATGYYRSLGESTSIINDRFEIVDILADCQELFAKLNTALEASWDAYYECAKRYYNAHGNLEVPARFVTEEGYAIGRWLQNQKSMKNGTLAGQLTPEQVAKLDALGMVWSVQSDVNWKRNLRAAEAYFAEHGDLSVPARFVTADGVALGAWLNLLRGWRKAGVHAKYLTQERVAALDALGMLWSVLDSYWERNYAAAEAYFAEHGNLDVPVAYKDVNGNALGNWVLRQRNLRAGMVKQGVPPTAKQIAKLDALGMVWTAKVDTKWEIGFEQCREYRERYGDLLVPIAYKTDEGYALGSWVQRQRKAWKAGKLDAKRQSRLEALGMQWEVRKKK